MTELTTEERILNGFLRVILDYELSAAERQAAAVSLRSGRLVECLLAVLEFSDEKRAETQQAKESATTKPMERRSSDSSSKKTTKNGAILSPEELFKLVRKRKVPKAALTDMISRLNSGLVLDVDEDASMREILETFKTVASDAEWITLTRAIGGEIVNDSYLSRILGR